MKVPFLEKKNGGITFQHALILLFYALTAKTEQKEVGGDQQHQHLQVDGSQITSVMVLHARMLNSPVE
jgi:hypothetical protein